MPSHQTPLLPHHLFSVPSLAASLPSPTPLLLQACQMSPQPRTSTPGLFPLSRTFFPHPHPISHLLLLILTQQSLQIRAGACCVGCRELREDWLSWALSAQMCHPPFPTQLDNTKTSANFLRLCQGRSTGPLSYQSPQIYSSDCPQSEWDNGDWVRGLFNFSSDFLSSDLLRPWS